MSQGLYSKNQVAKYLVCRPQEVARMIKADALPVVTIPSEKRPMEKITLHGLHGWLAARHSGAAFMTVDELAAEIAAANAPSKTPEALMAEKTFTECMNLFLAEVKNVVDRRAAA